MVQVYSAANVNAPIGKISDCNNTSLSANVALYRILNPDNNLFLPSFGSTAFNNDFAQAIYGDGPYTLLHPNSTTEFRAQNVDILA